MRCINCGKDSLFLRVNSSKLCKKCAAAKQLAEEAARKKQEQAERERLAEQRMKDLADAMDYYNTLCSAYEKIKDDTVVPKTAGLTAEEIDIKYNACNLLIEQLPLWRNYPLFEEVYILHCEPHSRLTGYLENPLLPFGFFRNNEHPNFNTYISATIDNLRISVKFILARHDARSRRKCNNMNADPVQKASHRGNTYYVTGVRFYEKQLLKLAIKNPDYAMVKQEIIDALMCDENLPKFIFKPERIELVPEPDNPHDPNAIKVIIDGCHVGYIKATECLYLLEAIKQERLNSITCNITGGPYKCVIEDYDIERDRDIYTLKRGDEPYIIKLNIIFLRRIYGKFKGYF